MTVLEKERLVARLAEVKCVLTKLDDMPMPAFVAQKLISIDDDLKLISKFLALKN